MTPARGERDQRLAELFRAHADFLWRVARRLGVPEADAEDVVQEVFLVVSAQIERYEERGALRAWLVSITRQVVQHAHRTRFRAERKIRELPAREAQPDPHRTLEQNEAVAFVNAFLAQLDPDQALVFYLSDVEDMTVPEIAGSLQLNVNTVYGRLRLARRRFEAQLQRRLRVEKRSP